MKVSYEIITLVLLQIIDVCNCSVFQENCGTTTFRRGKVVGGYTASPGEYPWLVSIRLTLRANRAAHYCGGVIVDTRWILTAAHCMSRYDEKNFIVRVGSFYRSKNNDPQLEDYDVSKIVRHPKYQYPSYYNDIALLKLDRDMDFKLPNVMPICLPAAFEEYFGRVGTVAGWGWLSQDRKNVQQPDVLQKVDLPVIDKKTCKKFYKVKNVKLRDTQMCAGYKEGGKDSCQGDSGGPLVIKERDGRHYVIGIVSAGIGCARRELPGLYTKVSHYRDWVLRVIDSPSARF